jgi:hypothetical protein
VFGILPGHPAVASRLVAKPYASSEALLNWCSEQVALISSSSLLTDEMRADCAEVVRKFGAPTMSLPIAMCESGWVDYAHVVALCGTISEVYLVQDAAYHLKLREYGARADQVRILPKVFVVNTGQPGTLLFQYFQNRRYPENWPEHVSPLGWGEWSFHQWTLEGLVIEAIAEAWHCTLDDTLKCSLQSGDHPKHKRVIAIGPDGEELEMAVDLIRKPQAPSASTE